MASTLYSTQKYNSLQSNDTQRLIQNISSNIQKIAQNVSQIENMNMQIGTSKDSESLRERLLLTENTTNQLAKETNNQLKELNNYVRLNTNSNQTNEDRQLKIQKERLTNDLVKTLNKFQQVQKLAMQKQRESNERAKANMNFNTSNNDEDIRLEALPSSTNHSLGYDGNNSDLNSLGYEHKNQAQVSMENDVNLIQLKEREAALKRLESDIVDVNMIFKDLAVMVHDQGEIIDSIESNVEAVQIRVTEANSHLEQAKKNQEKARKKKFILICVLAGVIAVVLFIIILSLQPWKN